MNVFQGTLLIAIAITGSLEAAQPTVKDFGILYNIKRLFGPSSAANLAKMSQSEKDDQLRFYAQKEWPHGSFISVLDWTNPDFEPSKKYFKHIAYLIEHGASVNLDIPYEWHNKVGDTGTFKPIYLFIKANDLEHTRALLKHGATIDNVIHTRGRSANVLGFAQTVDMAKLLMDYGAVITYNSRKAFRLSQFAEIPEAVAQAEYSSELIPFYLSHYEGDKLAFAQRIWDALQHQKWIYERCPELMKKFHQKKQYLKDAGVEINAQWDDDAFVWPRKA